MNVKSILTSHTLDLIDAQVLLAHVLNASRADLYAFDDRELTQAEYNRWLDLSARRLSGEPVAYLVGEKEFFGLSFIVTPDVLIPRPDTECLIEVVLSIINCRGETSFALLTSDTANINILDLGTGSGVIACAIASEKPDCQILATDISQEALCVAAQNVKKHALSHVMLRQSDGYENIPETFDLIVSNPPYLAENDLHLTGEIRFEPRGALVADDQGLHILHRVIEGATLHLNPGGYLCLEHGYEQAGNVREMMANCGFTDIKTIKDLSRNDRVTCARWRNEHDYIRNSNAR